ncbi:hypothetical protein HMPREF1531_00515 [Propionibacterium sp. oral taxon 192 str. F0372]|uniref:C40 family peptidase n=1 Tax=Propionibacterium sp. oral taxon 192 TaxID=671222 RepID=UPI0003545601|nr:C40 family peptidase [Propionibacterium sp. oral taxon 192]EPH06614.1 hypothetical protein HMPREF1531_00515 [Propionibacterium sp. oral taxon 192 str. F0372]
MTARRASTEVVDEQYAIGTAPARRSLGDLDPIFDDTLVSVQTAKASSFSFEPAESLNSSRALPKFSVTVPAFLRNSSKVQRSLMGVAAFASAGAVLVVPQVANAESAAQPNVDREQNASISRDTARRALQDPATLEAMSESGAAANAYLSAAADAQATAAQSYASQLEAANAALAAGDQKVAEKAEADRKAAEKAEADRKAAEKAEADRKAQAASAAQSSNTSSGNSASRPGAGDVTVSNNAVAGAASSEAVQTALNVAMAQVGKPYVYGATGPNAFDCSGLMVYSFKQAGISLPRTSQGQMSVGSAVSPSAMMPGDLIISYGGGHVGMYIGGGQMVHAATEGVGVVVSPVSQFSVTTVRRVG